MSSTERSHWPTLVITGWIALCASWLLSGCRFGNKVETAPAPETWSGVYTAPVKKVRLCATRHSVADDPNTPADETAYQTDCADTDQPAIPSILSSRITNPVIFASDGPSSGKGCFAPLGAEYCALTVGFAQDRSFTFLGSTDSDPVWTDPGCTYGIELEMQGQIAKFGASRVEHGQTLIGQVKMSSRLAATFSGACAPSLAKVEQCYQDANQCEGETSADNQAYQAQWRDLLGPLVEHGALDLSNVDALKAVSFEITYE